MALLETLQVQVDGQAHAEAVPADFVPVEVATVDRHFSEVPVADTVPVEAAVADGYAPGLIAVSGQAPGAKLDRRVAILQSEAEGPAAEMAKQTAFAQIVEEFQGQLQGFVKSIVGPNDVEEVVQDTFTNAYRAMGRFEQTCESGLKPWLYSIARNAALNVQRAKKSNPLAQAAIQSESGGPELNAIANLHSPIGEPGARLEFRETLAVLDEISERQLTAMVKRVDGHSYEEIADIQGTTVPGVKSLLVRGRKRANRLLQKAESFEIPKEDEDDTEVPEESVKAAA